MAEVRVLRELPGFVFPESFWRFRWTRLAFSSLALSKTSVQLASSVVVHCQRFLLHLTVGGQFRVCVVMSDLGYEHTRSQQRYPLRPFVRNLHPATARRTWEGW